jgi:hypothetical protein
VALAWRGVPARAGLPLGSEFQANTYSLGYQKDGAVALDAEGDFVVVWDSAPQDGSIYGVFGRRFSSAGTPQAEEFQVNVTTEFNQYRPALAMETNGDFVVVWTDSFHDSFTNGVFGRRFASDGSPLAGEFQINAYTPGAQYEASVASDADGDFVVAWRSIDQDGDGAGVFARRMTSSGGFAAPEFQVADETVGGQINPAVSIGANGDFVVAWTADSALDGYNESVRARHYSSNGVALASEFQVNTYTSGNQYEPAVAVNGDGGFVVVWTDDQQDGSSTGVFGRRFSSLGSALGAEFRVNVETSGPQRRAAVAIEADGDFAVVWDGTGAGGQYGVFERRFASSGLPVGGELQVSTTEYASNPAVASRAGGELVVVWENSYGDLDASSTDIFLRAVAVPTPSTPAGAAVDVDGDGEVEPLTDGLLLLRYLFGFRGATLITGAVDLMHCTRCTAPEIEAYIATLSAP